MIGFNGTYLPAATHHGMRITAAAIGGQWVIGGKWLKTATQQEILAAFGEEGMVVISKTNDYLNAIAATDHARAQQLADFIQEDPLLVCSLVETSKTRWLVGDGKGYVDTGVGLQYPVRSRSKIMLQTTGSYSIASSRNNNGNSRMYLIFFDNSRWCLPKGGDWTAGTSVVANKEYSADVSIDTANYKMIVNGVAEQVTAAPPVSSQSIYLFARNNVSTIDSQAPVGTKLAYITIEQESKNAHFIPMHRTDGTCGMLDIISGTFHPNANTQGQFTIAITDKA